MSVPEVLQSLHQHVPRFVAQMYTYLWESRGLPLDNHTRDLDTKLGHKGADIPPMPPDIEHRLWAGHDREEPRPQERQPDNSRQVDAATRDDGPKR